MSGSVLNVTVTGLPQATQSLTPGQRAAIGRTVLFMTGHVAPAIETNKSLLQDSAGRQAKKLAKDNGDYTGPDPRSAGRPVSASVQARLRARLDEARGRAAKATADAQKATKAAASAASGAKGSPAKLATPTVPMPAAQGRGRRDGGATCSELQLQARQDTLRACAKRDVPSCADAQAAQAAVNSACEGLLPGDVPTSSALPTEGATSTGSTTATTTLQSTSPSSTTTSTPGSTTSTTSATQSPVVVTTELPCSEQKAAADAAVLANCDMRRGVDGMDSGGPAPGPATSGPCRDAKAARAAVYSKCSSTLAPSTAEVTTTPSCDDKMSAVQKTVEDACGMRRDAVNAADCAAAKAARSEVVNACRTTASPTPAPTPKATSTERPSTAAPTPRPTVKPAASTEGSENADDTGSNGVPLGPVLGGFAAAAVVAFGVACLVHDKRRRVGPEDAQAAAPANAAPANAAPATDHVVVNLGDAAPAQVHVAEASL